MLKPGKTFNLSKQTKRFMATIVDAEQRNAFKRAMIQAELAAGIIVKSAPRDKNAPRGNTSSAPAGVTGSHAYTTPSAG